MRNAPDGYHGRYLRIDLGTGHAEPVPIEADALRRFIGGVGLGTWILLRESAENQEALAPEAPLVFVFSPLVGSPLTTSAKFAVVAKSPLTRRINDSLSSSHFAIAGKKTGYDAIVVVGAADGPTCLVIEPDRARLQDASDLWGRSVSETASALRQRLGAGFRTAVIGPAGENRVRFATISHDRRHAGRGGLGAVMGSKNLKAVAVRGDRLTDYAHPEQLLRYSRRLSKDSFGPATAKYRELGTVSNLLAFNRLGTLPTRNFQVAKFEGAPSLSPEFLSQTRGRTRDSCAACTIGCEHIFFLERQPPDQTGTSSNVPLLDEREGTCLESRSHRGAGQAVPPQNGVRLEYESLFALGSLCGIDDPDVVLRAASLCDEWGIDTISAGATLAFAMECAEKGLIRAEGLRFGNGPAMLEALESIVFRRGLGELFSLGTRAAAARIGQGASEFAPHVKGLEIPGYEPRALQTMALGFAVGTRGADHNRSGAYQADFSDAVDRLNAGPEAVRAAIQTEDEAAVMDSLILCKFLRGVFDDRMAAMAEMLFLVTGWDVTSEELAQTASRIVTAKKWYNTCQGWIPEEDTLPRRFLSEGLDDDDNGKAVLTEERLRSLIRQYNLARRWSAEGWVPREMLAGLEIVEPAALGQT